MFHKKIGRKKQCPILISCFLFSSSEHKKKVFFLFFDNWFFVTCEENFFVFFERIPRKVSFFENWLKIEAICVSFFFFDIISFVLLSYFSWGKLFFVHKSFLCIHIIILKGKEFEDLSLREIFLGGKFCLNFMGKINWKEMICCFLQIVITILFLVFRQLLN